MANIGQKFVRHSNSNVCGVYMARDLDPMYGGASLGSNTQCSFYYDSAAIDRITHGDVLDSVLTSNTWAIGMVHKPSTLATLQYIFAKFDSTGNQRGFILRKGTDDKFQAFLSNDGASAVNVKSTNAYTNTTNWETIVMVVDINEAVNADRVKIYYNGSAIALDAPSGTWASMFNNTAELTIGNEKPAVGRSYAGYLNHYFVLDNAPTAAEISAWHNGGTPLYSNDAFSGVQLLPDIDNATYDGGTLEWTVTDLSANGNDGNTKSGAIGSGDKDCNENPYL